MNKYGKSQAFQKATSGRYLKRSLTVMILVGSILNGINQGEQIIALSDVSILKLLLTFCVPFCVSTFASWTAILEYGQ